MVKVTYLGFLKEPDEGSQKAYEILTGRNLKPFYKVFSTPQKARPEQKPESPKQNTANYCQYALKRGEGLAFIAKLLPKLDPNIPYGVPPLLSYYERDNPKKISGKQ